METRRYSPRAVSFEFEILDGLVRDILAVMVACMDLDSEGNFKHGVRVSYISARVAEKLGWKVVPEIAFAGLIHDIGLLGKSAVIGKEVGYAKAHLMLPAEVSVKEHPYLGAQIIRELPVSFRGQYFIADAILEHHEWWSGKGFPYGKAKDDIVPQAQVIRAGDACDIYSRALRVADLPYPQREETVLRVIRNNGELGPLYFDALEALLIEDRILLEMEEDSVEEKIEKILRKYPAAIRLRGATSEAKEALLALIARLIDRRHPYTYGHSERVSIYSTLIAHEMGLPKEAVDLIRHGALIHDIGKFAVPIRILDKKGKLTKEEYEIVKLHAFYGWQLLKSFKSLRGYVFATLHHERMDGSGYPLGLKGDQIPLGARIIAVADVLDAVTSDRPYRCALNFQTGIDLIKEEARRGKLDPRVVKAAERILSDKDVVREGIEIWGEKGR